jgi:hypothetical protein
MDSLHVKFYFDSSFGYWDLPRLLLPSQSQVHDNLVLIFHRILISNEKNVKFEIKIRWNALISFSQVRKASAIKLGLKYCLDLDRLIVEHIFLVDLSHGNYNFEP